MNRTINIICFALLFLFAACSSDSTSEESIIPEKKEEQKELSANKWSDSQKKQALNDCITSRNPKEFCECSVVQLTSLFSYEEFNTFNSEIRSGKQPSPEIVSKMIEMSKRVQDECPQPR